MCLTVFVSQSERFGIQLQILGGLVCPHHHRPGLLQLLRPVEQLFLHRGGLCLLQRHGLNIPLAVLHNGIQLLRLRVVLRPGHADIPVEGDGVDHAGTDAARP